MNFSAARLPIATFCPSYTAPIPPRPMSRTTRHLAPTTLPINGSGASASGVLVMALGRSVSPPRPAGREGRLAGGRARASGGGGLQLVRSASEAALQARGLLRVNDPPGGGAVDGLAGSGYDR